MLGSSILDVAIGMAFIYLLLSLIASTVQEAFATFAQARSATLVRGIRSLFSGGCLNDKPLVDLLYNHGLIRGLYSDPAVDLKPGNGKSVYRRLKEWARFLVDKFLRIPPAGEITGVADPFLLPSYIPARSFAIAMMDLLNPEKTDGKNDLDNIEKTLIKLRETVKEKNQKDTHKAAEAMLALLADARKSEKAMEQFQTNLENWYNDAMDRVSGWYKHYTQKLLLVIGLLLALGFNVDSIRVGRTLWFERDTLQGLVNTADAYVKSGSGAKPSANCGDGTTGLTCQMANTVRSFDDISKQYLLPVGWKHPVSAYWTTVVHSKGFDILFILEKLSGWIITAFALSLGAPFWFDTLNRFMVVRNTIKPQEKNRSEPSKG